MNSKNKAAKKTATTTKQRPALQTARRAKQHPPSRLVKQERRASKPMRNAQESTARVTEMKPPGSLAHLPARPSSVPSHSVLSGGVSSLFFHLFFSQRQTRVIAATTCHGNVVYFLLAKTPNPLKAFFPISLKEPDSVEKSQIPISGHGQSRPGQHIKTVQSKPCAATAASARNALRRSRPPPNRQQRGAHYNGRGIDNRTNGGTPGV